VEQTLPAKTTHGIPCSLGALLLGFLALTNQGWYLLLLWPALSLGIVASGYFYFGSRVYGKTEKGRLSKRSTFLLLPYLLCRWAMWYANRPFNSESPIDKIADNIYIGRRLRDGEVSEDIDCAIDLTCEFNESKSLRSLQYYSYPILDDFAPSIKQLESWVKEADKLSGKIFIHCAEGHGRAPLFAAALLLYRREFDSVEEVFKEIELKRPSVYLGPRQRTVLEEWVQLLRDGNSADDRDPGTPPSSQTAPAIP